VIAIFTFLCISAFGPVAANDAQEVASRSVKAIMAEANLPAAHAASHTSWNNSARVGARMIASFVSAQRREHPREPLPLLFRRATFRPPRSKFPNAKETFSAEPLQKFDKFRRKGVKLA